ncbi:hypothetical protein ABZY36_03115 [Streptomyces sp. NPDC006627]|uniref:hypothetical protein n=1 Tax=Streptomyces sp. NPDC006627 TaxID=3154679 RepID=UPI0033BE32CF
MSGYHYSHEWGYLAAEAEQPDPRVVVSVGGAWVEQSCSLSEFLMRLAFERMPAHYGWTLRARTAPRTRSYGTGAGPAPTSGSSSTPVRATRSSRSPRPWASTGPATRRSARRASCPRPWRTSGRSRRRRAPPTREDLADVRQARGGRGDAQLAAVREALPALRYLHDDPESASRWAADELEQNRAASPA